jgi:hypothetical protein
MPLLSTLLRAQEGDKPMTMNGVAVQAGAAAITDAVMTGYSSLIPVLSTVQLDHEISDAVMDALLLLSHQSGRPLEDHASDILVQHVYPRESSIA